MKKRLNKQLSRQQALLYLSPTHADLIVRIGKEIESWYLPIPEAAYLARMVQGIFIETGGGEGGNRNALFRLGDKVTYAKWEGGIGKVSIELKPVGKGKEKVT